MRGTDDSLDANISLRENNQATSCWSRLAQIAKKWISVLYPTLPTNDNAKSNLQSVEKKDTGETLGRSLQRMVYTAQTCDLHDLLRATEKFTWPERHLLIDDVEHTLEITKSFRKGFENIKESSSIVDQVNIIKEFYSQFSLNDKSSKEVGKYLEDACRHNDPKYVVKAYTSHAELTGRLNSHLAANAYHFIKLYCTILNCPTLHITKDYVDAFTYILSHPKLKEYQVKQGTFYRGMVLNDEKLIAEFGKGKTILTTTFLSTSKEQEVAEGFSGLDKENSTKISVFCTYILNNDEVCSALDISSLSQFPVEKEVLILRYVPFKIKLIEPIEKGRGINICFEEYSKKVLDSISTTDVQHGSRKDGLADNFDEPNITGRHGEENSMFTISNNELELKTNRDYTTSRR